MPINNQSEILISQELSIESLIERMQQCVLEVSGSEEDYTSYSKQFEGKTLKETNALLNEMLEKSIFPNTVILNQLIKYLSQLQQFPLAVVIDLYKITVTKGLADTETYNNILIAIAESEKPDAILAMHILDEARKAGFADITTFNSTLNALAKSKRHFGKAAMDLFEAVKETGLLADTITYNSTLATLANGLHPIPHFTMNVLREAQRAGLADIMTYLHSLNAITKSLVQPDKLEKLAKLEVSLLKKIWEIGVSDVNYTLIAIASSPTPNSKAAMGVLEEALKKGLAKTINYNSILIAIAKNERQITVFAQRLYEEATKAGVADTITFNCTLATIANNRRPSVSAAMDLLEKAKRAGLADVMTFLNTLDVIARSHIPYAELAETVLNETIEQFKLDDMSNGVSLNLHDLSYGFIYFGLKKRVQQEIDKKMPLMLTMVLDYEEGLYSPSGEEIHPSKQAVLRVISELSGKGVSGRENEHNPGVFELSIQPVSRQLHEPAPNAIVQNISDYTGLKNFTADYVQALNAFCQKIRTRPRELARLVRYPGEEDSWHLKMTIAVGNECFTFVGIANSKTKCRQLAAQNAYNELGSLYEAEGISPFDYMSILTGFCNCQKIMGQLKWQQYREDNMHIMEVSLTINDKSYSGVGKGRTLKLAKQNTAYDLLTKINQMLPETIADTTKTSTVFEKPSSTPITKGIPKSLETYKQIQLSEELRHFMFRIGILFNAKAYIWGGYVRDKMDDVEPNDVDIILIPNSGIRRNESSERRAMQDTIWKYYPSATIKDLHNKIPGLFRIDYLPVGENNSLIQVDIVYKHQEHTLEEHVETCDLLINSFVCDMDGAVSGTKQAISAYEERSLAFNPDREDIGLKEFLRQHRLYVNRLGTKPYYIPPNTRQLPFKQGPYLMEEETARALLSELRKHFVHPQCPLEFMMNYWLEHNIVKFVLSGLSSYLQIIGPKNRPSLYHLISEKMVNLANQEDYFLEDVLIEMIKCIFFFTENTKVEVFLNDLVKNDVIFRILFQNTEQYTQLEQELLALKSKPGSRSIASLRQGIFYPGYRPALLTENTPSVSNSL